MTVEESNIFFHIAESKTEWLEHGDNVVAEMVERLQNEPAGNEEGHSQRNRIMRTPSVRNTCWEDEPLSSSEGEK